MEENKNLTPEETTDKAPQTPAKAEKTPVKKAAKKEEKNARSGGFADYKAEFKKIIWPNRAELKKKTGTVIVTSLLMGLIIFCMDTVFTTAYNLVLGLLG